MDESKREVSRETARFHQVVETGSLDELRQVLRNGAEVNAPGRLEQTPLMVAITTGDLEKMRLLVDHGADPELTDEFNATALRHAVACDLADGVQFLLSLGVDHGYEPKYPLKEINYDIDWPDVQLPEEISGLISDEEWKRSLQETEESMSEFGQHPTVEPMIADVQSVDVLKLFLDSGDDLSLAPNDVRRSFIGIGNADTLKSTVDDYRKHKSPRFGTCHPERIENPFWDDMVRSGGSAYSARVHFHDTDACTAPGAVWCYDRFGATMTPLKDGRFVQVGGEHEDHYDPDFCIYNDVVVHDGAGGFQIYGYPKQVFPPIDFHTATLVGDWIYIIGCIGYPEQRKEGRTPVYRLELDTWKIEVVHASGDMPSWLHRHRVRYDPYQNVIQIEGGGLQVKDNDGNASLVPNDARFEFDPSSARWRKVN